MRTPVSLLSWWKRTDLRDTAEYSLTGTVTSPKEMAPVQIDLGMDAGYLRGRHSPAGRTLRCTRRRQVAQIVCGPPGGVAGGSIDGPGSGSGSGTLGGCGS